MPGSSEYRERHSWTVPGIDHHIMIVKITMMPTMKMVTCGISIDRKTHIRQLFAALGSDEAG